MPCIVIAIIIIMCKRTKSIKKKKLLKGNSDSSDNWTWILQCCKCFHMCNPKSQEIQKEKF